ncbi:MAG: hypothetical protein WCP18_04415, partial [bacterium]
MVFLLIRFLPFVLPIVYWLMLMATNYDVGYWQIFLAVICIADLVYFLLLYLRTKKYPVIWLFLHSWIFVCSGWFFILILDKPLLLQVFAVIWSAVYFVYLESVFHHFYETEKVSIIDLNHIIGYANFAIFFLTLSCLFNVFIFLDLKWWWFLAIAILVSFVLLFSQMLIAKMPSRKAFLSSVWLMIILTEIVAGFMILPISFYVSAFVGALSFYFFVSLFLLAKDEKIKKQTIWQYAIFF